MSKAVLWSLVDIAYILDQYISKKRTLANIAEEFDVSENTIRRLLIEYKVKRRRPDEYRFNVSSLDEEYIKNEYVVKRRSYYEMATELKIPAEALRKFLNMKGWIRIRKRAFTDTEKWCNDCQQMLSLAMFGNHNGALSGKQAYCKSCAIQRSKRYDYGHYRRKVRYGITKEQYSNLFQQQGGKCAICKREEKLVVDHDHKTKVVRGLLCSGCNVMLGHYKDDVSLIQRCIEYLKIGQQKENER